MTITLDKDFAIGTTDYIEKHNDNYTLIESAINVLQVQVANMVAAGSMSIMVFTPPTTDHNFSGEVVSFVAGESLSFGDICYIKSDGKIWKAKADSNTTLPGVVISLGSVSAEGTGLFLLKGFLRDDSWTWTVGGTNGLLYVSNGTAGLITQTPLEYIQILGYAYSSTILFFDPESNFEGVPSQSPSASASISPSKSPSYSPSLSPSLSPSISPSPST